jgi:hypothetical protein
MGSSTTPAPCAIPSRGSTCGIIHGLHHALPDVVAHGFSRVLKVLKMLKMLKMLKVLKVLKVMNTDNLAMEANSGGEQRDDIFPSE